MIPAGYKQIEYVQSNGTGSYFKTGIKPNANTRVIFDGYVVSGDTALYGSRYNNADNRYAVQLIGTNVYRLGYVTSEQVVATSYTKGVRYTFDQKNGQLYINDTLVATVSLTASFPNAQEIYAVGALNTKGNATNLGVVRMYSMQIYQDDVLVRDFLPVQDSTGKGGIFDQVTQTFYGNSGSGEIACGEIISTAELTGITVTPPTKTEYLYGDDLDTTGMTVTGTYNDGTTSAILNYELTGYDKNALGQQAVTVTYDGFTGTFSVNVSNAVTGIEVTPPTKVQYYIDDPFDDTGMVVNVVWLDGSRTEVTEYTVSGFDSSVSGEKTLTVTYDGMTAQFTVQVGTITGIEVTPPIKTEYCIRESFDSIGMTVREVWSDGRRSNVTDYTLSGFDNKSAGEKTVSVSYYGFTQQFIVTVLNVVMEYVGSPNLEDVAERLDLATYVMTISGTGKMKDRSSFTESSIIVNYGARVQEVICNAGVTSVGDYAFFDCSSLASIILPDSVARIGKSAFGLCKSLTSVTIPENITIIENYSFGGCSSLMSIKIPEGVTMIAVSAFSGCSSLTSAVIPESVTSIGDSAFNNCTSLTSIAIPNGVTSVGDYAFNGCASITTIAVAKNNETYDSRDDCNAIIETATNTLIFGCKNTAIPNGVTSVGDYAFFDCSSLASIILPDSVARIGKSAFNGCTGLISVMIPNSVTSIGNSAFSRDENLTIYGYKDSYAETYASSNKIKFVYIVHIPVCVNVTTFPAKIKYLYGEEFDATGMSVSATYDDGTSESATDYTISGYDKHTLGEQTVTVIYNTIAADESFKVTVSNFTTGITIVAPPTKTVYQEGEPQDNSGLTVALTYADGNTEEITDYTISSIDTSTRGQQTVTVTYEDYSANFSVTVITFYDLFELLGNTADMETIRNNSKNDDGTDAVTGVDWFKFNNVVASKLYVSGNNWIGFGTSSEQLKICRRDGATYYVRRQEGVLKNGHKFLKLEVEGYTYYSSTSDAYKLIYELYLFDDNSMFLNMLNVPTNSSYLGTSALVCGSNTTALDITAGEPVMYSFYPTDTTGTAWTAEKIPHVYLLNGIAITMPVNKLSYFAGEELDLTGMVVTASYATGATGTVTNYVVSGYNPDVLGEQTVTISYKEMSTTFAVEVKGNVATGIRVTPPTKTEYKLNEPFDGTGMTVYEVCSNGSETEVTDYMMCGFDSSTAGTKTITVSYQDFTSRFSVIVRDNFTVTFTDKDGNVLKTETVSHGASATQPTPPIVEGYNFSGWSNSYENVTADVTCQAQYTIKTFTVTWVADGSTIKTETVNWNTNGTPPENPAKENYVFIGWDKDYTGINADTVITARYKAHTASIHITHYPDKLYYKIGEAFDSTGLVVMAVKYDGIEEETTEYDLSGFDSETTGRKYINVVLNEDIGNNTIKPMFAKFFVKVTADGTNPFDREGVVHGKITVHWPNGEFKDLTNDDIKDDSVVLKESICSANYFIFGGCISNQITFQTDSDQFISTAESATPHGDIEIYLEVEKTKVKIFTGTIDTGKRTNDLRTREIIAYDGLYKFRNTDISRWYKNKTTDKQMILTQKQFRNALFTYLGIEQVETTLTYDNVLVPNNNSDNEINVANILKDLCMQNAVFGWMNRDGKFEYLKLSENSRPDTYNNDGSIKKFKYFAADVHYDMFKSCEFTEGRIWAPFDFYTDPSPHYMFSAGEPASAQEAYENNVYFNRNSFFVGNSDWLDSAWKTDEYGCATVMQPIFPICYGTGVNVYTEGWYRAQGYKMATKGNPLNKVGDTIEIAVRRYLNDGTMLQWIIHSYIMSRTLKIYGNAGLEDTYEAKNSPYNGNNSQAGKVTQKLTAELFKYRSERPTISYADFTTGSGTGSDFGDGASTMSVTDEVKKADLRCVKRITQADFDNLLASGTDRKDTLYFAWEE